MEEGLPSRVFGGEKLSKEENFIVQYFNFKLVHDRCAKQVSRIHLPETGSQKLQQIGLLQEVEYQDL